MQLFTFTRIKKTKVLLETLKICLHIGLGVKLAEKFILNYIWLSEYAKKNCRKPLLFSIAANKMNAGFSLNEGPKQAENTPI